MLLWLLNLGFAAGGAPEPTPAVSAEGGHYWPDVKQDDWREKSQKQRREFLLSLINGAEAAPEAVQDEIREILEPYKPGPRITKNGLNELAENIRAVERLIQVIEAYQDDDDAAFLLMA